MQIDDAVALAIVLEHYEVGEGVRWPPFDVENVWANPLGEPYYEVRSLAFYATGVNLGDVVEARPREGFTDPVLVAVVRRSGAWTVHLVVIDGGSETAQALLDRAAALGCTVDHDDTTGLVALSVPATLDVALATALLEEGKRADAWDVEIASEPLGH